MTNPSELLARLKGSQAQTQAKQEAPVPPPFMQQQTPQAQHTVVASEQQQTLTAPPLGLGQTSVTQQLQKIGDRQEINPPRTPIGVPPEHPPAQETNAGKSACPHCKKEYQRLGGHIKKCPVRLAQEAQEKVLQDQITQNVIPPGAVVAPEATTQNQIPGVIEEPFLPTPTGVPYPDTTNKAEQEVNAWAQPTQGLNEKQVGQVIEKHFTDALNQQGQVQEAPISTKLVLIIGALIQKADIGLQFVDFTDFISPICTQMMADQKVAYWNQLEFGKSGPMLSAYLDEHLKNLSSADELTLVVSDTTSAEYRACSGVLQRYASRIIRGIHG